MTEAQVEEARLAMEAAREAVLASKKTELDDIEDMFYEDPVEELANEFGIELLDDEDE